MTLGYVGHPFPEWLVCSWKVPFTPVDSEGALMVSSSRTRDSARDPDESASLEGEG